MELKLCPFCRNKDGNYLVKEVEKVEFNSPWTTLSKKPCYRGHVECGCGAYMYGGLYDGPEDAEIDAVNCWNRRANDV